MNLFFACEVLDIWPIAKARAEVWSMSDTVNSKSLNNLKTISKNRFKELAKLHHPDKGGDHAKFVRLTEAHEIIKEASVDDFINTLKDENENNVVHYEPGSLQCKNCVRWSEIVGLCITVSCSGFKSQKESDPLGFNRVQKQKREMNQTAGQL